MNGFSRICFLASDEAPARLALDQLTGLYGNIEPEQADVIIALGGDGFMLHTLHATRGMDCPVYGMNRGTVGFLMNAYSVDNLKSRLNAAEAEVINPLEMLATDLNGDVHTGLAINEVSLFRAGAQAVKLRVTVDGKPRLDELMCDGALLATPAGSTAYNYSALGPILPLGSNVLALTAIAAFRPRRWRGALLPATARVDFDVLERNKRPCMADYDGRSAREVVRVSVVSKPSINQTVLFDPGHGLQERLLREQFV